MEADVGALTCVLPHVDLEFVLSGKGIKATCFQMLWVERLTHKLLDCVSWPL